MRPARLVIAVAAIAGVLSSCQSATVTPPGSTPSPFTGTAVQGIGESASLGWDGVEKRVMLVANIQDARTRLTHIGVWLQTTRGWQPMKSPDVTADESGFAYLSLDFDSNRKVELLVSTTKSPPATAVVSEWNGTSWRELTPGGAPAHIAYGAYSPSLHSWVGLADGNVDNRQNAWLYDGASWHQTASIPTANRVQSVAYDPGLHSVVALDSFDFSTYVFDGNSWTKLPSGPPVPDPYAAVVFNPDRRQWLAFGGAGGRMEPTATTWIGSEQSWASKSSSSSATPRYQISANHMTWDAQRQRAVLFGGIFKSGLAYGDTWEWNGTDWTKVLDAAPLADAAYLPPPEACVPSAGYGLVMASGSLDVVDTCAKLKASVPVAASAVTTCAAGGDSAVIEPPVSATNDKIFYRDGDTKIRSLALDGSTSDVTTVPGGPTTVSMFSVSPDDKRIAVLVEDLAGPDAVSLRLYVEDLIGGGHSTNIYSASVSKKDGNTLWPMGWHDGQLVLAVMKACAADASSIHPAEWHVSNASTGDRTATVTNPGAYCTFAVWPSSAGATCAGSGWFYAYDWTSRLLMSVDLYLRGPESGLSPSRQTYFAGCSDANGTTTCIVSGTRQVGVGKVSACLWIDDDHLLAPDAIISMPPAKFPYSEYAPVYPLSARGACAGRFPGGL